MNKNHLNKASAITPQAVYSLLLIYTRCFTFLIHFPLLLSFLLSATGGDPIRARLLYEILREMEKEEQAGDAFRRCDDADEEEHLHDAEDNDLEEEDDEELGDDEDVDEFIRMMEKF